MCEGEGVAIFFGRCFFLCILMGFQQFDVLYKFYYTISQAISYLVQPVCLFNLRSPTLVLIKLSY